MNGYSFLPISYPGKTEPITKAPTFMDLYGTGSNNINAIYNNGNPAASSLPTHLTNGEFGLDTTIPTGGSPGFNWGELANTKGLGGMVLGGLQTGLAGWQTWNNYQAQKEAAKLGRQEMALMKEDFANNARNTNRSLEDRKAVSLNMKGINLDSPEGKAQMAAYMDKWRVNERPIG